MALNLKISNSLTHLADHLSKELNKQPVSVFQPHYIITQTEGMNNWLKLQIAAHLGIAANCVFVSPNEIMQKVYSFLGGKYPNMLSGQNLTWLLYKILGYKSFTRRFVHVAAYFDYDGPDSNLKRMALAEKAADLFDQYQVYRPEWIERWNTLEPGEVNAGDWQPYLWIKARELSAGKLPDKTVIGKYIIEALKDDAKGSQLKAKIPALHIFGLSITTDYHLELFYALSSSIDTSFHIMNPAPTVYWFEDRSEKQMAILSRKGLVDPSESSQGNMLLTSWGRVIQDTFMMLFKNEALLNSFNEIGIEAPLNNTLLHKIQHDVFYGAATEERNLITLEDVADGSVNISSCYTIAREVEVLYNYLVYLVDEKRESLSPRDIVVMVTDIDAYAPYIKAVFKNAPYTFHFTIADESYANGDTLVNALTAILKINRHNFKAEAILQLLDSGYIRKRFNITNLELVRQVVSASNTRFGIEGDADDETRFVSWQYGIKRIIYGICISGSEAYTDPEGESLFPLDMVEGSDTQEVIRFCHFIQVLIDSITERDQQASIAEWVNYIERLIKNMLCEAEDEVDEDYALLQKQLTHFNVADTFMEEKIGFDIFSHSLLQSISGAGRSGSFAGGGITFCSLIPMRSIPFKVVALLGINFDQFPRKETPASFNLFEKDKRRRGDRNVKENDKHLFLETILSAKEYLYISYIGLSAKDNTALPPSALVDELVDYIEGGCAHPEEVRPSLVTKHPLHSFSPKYNRRLPGYYNYLNNNSSVAVQTTTSEKTIEPFNFEEISLDNLTRFFKHPFKAYYNKVLAIYYEEEQVLLSDTEVFELDSLQKWSIKPQLMDMDTSEVGELKDRLVKTGGLPLKYMGDVAIENVEQEVAVVRALFKTCVENTPEEKITFEINFENCLFKGTLHHLYGNKMVFVSYSKNENKYLLDAYIRYLAARAYGLDHEVYFISASKEAIFRGTTISKEQAFERLKQLIELYKEGHEKIIAFFPGIKIKPSDVDLLDEPVLKKALNDFFHHFMYPCDDPYLKNENRNGYFKAEDITERYKANAKELIKPLEELFPGYWE